MGPERVPDRIRQAIELVDPQPGEQILEVGCGTGVAAAVIADHLDGGHLVAIDRSATAITRASSRLAGTAVSLVHTALGDFVADRTFDKAFSINVNVFWTGPARDEFRVLNECIRPGGRLYLCYETPHGAKADRIVNSVTEGLTRNGFTPTVVRHRSLCVVGERDARA